MSDRCGNSGKSMRVHPDDAKEWRGEYRCELCGRVLQGVPPPVGPRWQAFVTVPEHEGRKP